MAIIEPVGSGKETTHWNCSDCSFWSKDPAAVEQHIVDVHGGTAAADEPLAARSNDALMAIATELGLEMPKRPTKAQLLEAIESEQERMHEAAAAEAAAKAAAEGDGDQGGSNVPGDDSEASSSDEPGAPPAE